ncbi:MAG: nitrate/sulfonate/bicarbonate ABC transporter ATP-binding protein [Deltaproteobacteria bacterium]|nr:nitrate/sulfonate/bicarbonate ABC transporter ATP-binding protein [Deltaproteobacteria bacterium]MBI3294087.1 nitrate/sulfonate/bicarbonate ABC transporter ATP-binding protein [Deltaproteobacteria bacterium]
MTPLIELKHVDKSFVLESGNTLNVLEGIDISLNEGEVLALLGPSGSGKSTCLRIMSGLVAQTDGDVFAEGHPLDGINENVAMVFQSFALFPWETVYDNIALALKPMGLSPSEVKARSLKAIDLVGLEGFEEAYPRELSGGMKQRVGIARAIVMDRPVIFLDEPFSALDVLTADTLRSEMVKIFLSGKTASKSMLLVTHNIQEAVVMAKRILIMGVNPGHIRHEIKNDLPYPRDASSPAFAMIVNQLHGLVTETLIPDIAEIPTTATPGGASTTHMEMLPNVQVSEMIGFLEALHAKGGTADIFELSRSTGREFAQTLFLVKAAEFLELVDSPKQTVVLMESGKSFVLGDINTRKKILHELFGNLDIVRRITELLKQSETLRLPATIITEKLQEWLPQENADAQMSVLIGWGRFAEYFGYNDDLKEVYLDVGQEAS